MVKSTEAYDQLYDIYTASGEEVEKVKVMLKGHIPPYSNTSLKVRLITSWCAPFCRCNRNPTSPDFDLKLQELFGAEELNKLLNAEIAKGLDASVLTFLKNASASAEID